MDGIREVFLRLNKWQEQLYSGLENNCAIQELCETARGVFDNAIFIHDSEYRVLANDGRTLKRRNWDYNNDMKAYTVPINIINQFKHNKDYHESMGTEGPSVFSKETLGYRVLYQNLWYQGRYLGRICVNEVIRPIRKSDFSLLELFAKIIIEFYKGWDTWVRVEPNNITSLLSHLIENHRIDSMAFDKALMLYNWSAKDDYFCACAFLEKGDTRINSLSYMCRRFQDEIPKSCIFTYNQQIVFVINITESGMSIKDFQSTIAFFLRDGIIKIGISSIGHNLAEFRHLYFQAVIAYETGCKSRENYTCYSFDDFRTDYIIQNAIETLPAEYVSMPEILKLERYDNTNAADMAITLKVYLENDRNIARASEVLNVHRTTLLYRIGRIEKITGLDFEDYETRFLAMLSFHMLDKSRGHV